MKIFKIASLSTLIVLTFLSSTALAAEFTPAEISLRGTTDDMTIDLNWDTANGTAPYGYRILWSLEAEPTFPLGTNDIYDTRREETTDHSLIDYLPNTGTYYIRICVIDEEDNCAAYSNQLTFYIDILNEEIVAEYLETQEEELPPEILLTDIEGHMNQTAIEYLYANEVISGYPDNTYRPDNTVNRAELLKILVGGKGLSPSIDQYSNCFPDVTNEWFAPYICYAKSSGWVEGYPDGTFTPGLEVNKAEAIKMLVNSQGYKLPSQVEDNLYIDVMSDTWFAPYIQVAKDKGLLEEIGSLYHPAEYMTRAQISENIYRAMFIQENGLETFPIIQ